MFTIIVSIGKNGEIGVKNDLIWRIPEDMRFFRMMTINHKVVMGRKTFESLPNGKLSDRENFVVTTNTSINLPEDINIISDFESFLKENYSSEEEIFIIGGEKIYKLALPYVNKMIITHIDREEKNADAYFNPDLSEKIWKKNGLVLCDCENIKYCRTEYTRI